MHDRPMLTRRRSSKRVHNLRKPAAMGPEGLLSIHCMPLAELPVRRTQSIDSYLARSTGESVTRAILAAARHHMLIVWQRNYSCRSAACAHCAPDLSLRQQGMLKTSCWVLDLR